MERKVAFFGFLFVLVMVQIGFMQNSRVYLTTFENIQFLNAAGEETKVHLVQQQHGHLFLVSRDNIIFDYDIRAKKLIRYLIPTLNTGDVTAFVALRPDYFVLAQEKRLYKIKLPALYPYLYKNLPLRYNVVQLLPLSSESVLVVTEYLLYLFYPETGSIQKIYALPARSNKFKGARITPDGKIRAFTNNAFVTVEFFDSRSTGRTRQINGVLDIKGDSQGNTYLLTKNRLTILKANRQTQRITVQGVHHLTFDRANNIWVYGNEVVYRVQNGNVKKVDLLKSGNFFPILFLTEGLPGELLLVSPKYLTIIHGIITEEAYIQAILNDLKDQCVPLHAWPFYVSEVRALLHQFPQIQSNILKAQILSLLAEGIVYLPQFQQQIITATLQLPTGNERQKILQKLVYQLSGQAWPLAVYLEKEKIKTLQSIEAKIRGELRIGQLMAVDTVNYSLAGYKLSKILNQYENVIFNDGLRDSLIFLALKYAPGFPFNAQSHSRTLWEKLTSPSATPLMQRYAQYHFFNENSITKFSINTGQLWNTESVTYPVGTTSVLPTPTGAWVIKNSRLYFVPPNGNSRAFRLKMKALAYLQTTPIGLTADGRLVLLKPEGVVDFQPRAPKRLNSIWASGNQLVGMRQSRKPELFLFDGESGKWDGPFHLPGEIARESFIYAQRMTETEFLLVTSTKAYRFNRNSGQVLSLMVPAEILRIFDCERDTKGGFYFATNTGLWYRNVGGQWQHVSKTDGLPEQPVWDLSYHFGKGVLGIVGPQYAALADAFGWIVLDLPQHLQNQQGMTIQLDPQLNAVIYQGDQALVWKRGDADRRNMVNRLLRIAPDFMKNHKSGDLLKLVKRSGRIPELNEWATAFQFFIFLKNQNYTRALETLELALGKPRKSNDWIHPLDGLILLDLHFDHQDWKSGLRAWEHLYPLLKSSQNKTAYLEYLLQRLREYGSSFMPLEKLAFVNWFAQTSVETAYRQQIERIANGCLAYLWITQNNEVHPILRRLTDRWMDSPMKDYWNFLQFLIVSQEARAEESRQIFLQHLRDSSNPLIRSRAGMQFLATSVAMFRKPNNTIH